MSDITVHMVVKNEDQWIWFALQSVLPYVDSILVTDTGSRDDTTRVVKSISSPKIALTVHPTNSPNEVTTVRQRQINMTKTSWLWLVDGDEIYPMETAKEAVAATRRDYEGVAVRRYDLLGDVYHRQDESVGAYELYGKRGHLVSRLFNRKKIPGLYVEGAYPQEAYYDGDGQRTQGHDPASWYVTSNYLYHAMYLRRSSAGSNLSYVVNRKKYKIEKGIPVTAPQPEVFGMIRPAGVPDPTKVRSRVYELAATIITPVKKMKRAVM